MIRSVLDEVIAMKERGDTDWWPYPMAEAGDDGVLSIVAAIELSGFDCNDPSKFPEAVEHCMKLVSCGVYTTRQWAAKAQEIEQELMAWGKAVDRRLARIALSN